MADIIDKASEQYDFLFEKTLQAQRRMFERPSNKECDECGVEIPERRRQIGGIKYCIDCQTELENQTKRMRGGR